MDVNVERAEQAERGEREDVHGGEVRPFLAFLQEHRKGALHDELSVRLNELVEAVRTVRKKGRVTLSIEVSPVVAGAYVVDDQVIVKDDVKMALPEADREASIMFVDKSGNLSRANPALQELPLREVRGGKVDDVTQLKEVAR